MPTDNNESAQAGTESPPPAPYADAVRAYLEAADWLTIIEGPWRVQAEQLARTLDSQLARTGEVQSATASQFDKVLLRLEARRPIAPPAPTDPAAAGSDGTASIFELLDGS